jgi:hypothetical protein
MKECAETTPGDKKNSKLISPPANAAAYYEAFCFESEDGKSLIINYSGLDRLLQVGMPHAQVIERLIESARSHMRINNTPQFIFHLFCNGVVMKDIVQHRKFMVSLAVMFRDHFPVELYACYVHHAPSFFRSVYDLLQGVLPKASRDKIIMVKPASQPKSNRRFARVGTASSARTAGSGGAGVTSEAIAAPAPADGDVCRDER